MLFDVDAADAAHAVRYWLVDAEDEQPRRPALPRCTRLALQFCIPQHAQKCIGGIEVRENPERADPASGPACGVDLLWIGGVLSLLAEEEVEHGWRERQVDAFTVHGHLDCRRARKVVVRKPAIVVVGAVKLSIGADGL